MSPRQIGGGFFERARTVRNKRDSPAPYRLHRLSYSVSLLIPISSGTAAAIYHFFDPKRKFDQSIWEVAIISA